MKKCFFIALLFIFTGIILAQNNKQTHESDITEVKDKKDNLDAYLPLSKSPNTVQGAVYADVTKPAGDRARDLIRRMTFEEKLNLTGGFPRFQTHAVERLGIRPAFMADASQGVRLNTVTVGGQSTSFPGMLPLASTWNGELAREFGAAIAEECRALGLDILLGPGINMQRLSVGGRNFEYMGEDPLLTSIVAANYVYGMEKIGVIACPKHFIGNDQEFCRHISNTVVSERALREIYLPPWEAVVKDGNTSAIMTGNNLVNGAPAAIHRPLNAGLLRKEYDFKGIAMTDWQNTNYFPSMQHLVLPSGENLLMPRNNDFAAWVKKEVQSSPERKAEIELMLESMIFPTLYTLFEKGVYDRHPQHTDYLKTYEGHKELARKVAEESVVLLKNEKNILPIAKGKKIVFYGEPEVFSGEGSGFVAGYDHTTYAEGLQKVYGKNFLHLEKMDEKAIRKADIVIYNLNKKSGEGRDIPFEEGAEGLEELKKISKLNRNVVVLVNSCNGMSTDWVKDVKGVLWCYFLGQERGNALANIISGKVAPSGRLPFTIEKSFRDSPAPDYNYIGDKIFWFGNNQYKNYWLGKTADFDSTFTNYVKPFEPIDIPYKEDILIGYRWYDYHKIPVRFPFGAGLSYTKFELSGMSVENKFKEENQIAVEFDVKNVGTMEGKDVVQVYVSHKGSTVMKAPKELKAFRKIHLTPGEKQKVRITLDERAFSYWDEENHDWKVEQGEYIISIRDGISSDLSLSVVL